MHADEAILADKLGTLLASGAYPYDPREYHGPVLGYLAWIPAHLARQTTYHALSETTLRIAPAIAGIFLALSPLLFAPLIGPAAATWAAAMVAVSPVIVYYSRYFIPEIPLALWTALFLASLLHRSASSWALAGVAAALMLATKQTAVLALADAAIAYAVTFHPRRIDYHATALFAATLTAGFSLLLAPPWKWGMLAQSATAYFERGSSGGLHGHPWYGYFQWLLGWHYSFTEAPILLLGAAGLVLPGESSSRLGRFLAWYTRLLIAIYAAIPYKTPWCAVNLKIRWPCSPEWRSRRSRAVGGPTRESWRPSQSFFCTDRHGWRACPMLATRGIPGLMCILVPECSSSGTASRSSRAPRERRRTLPSTYTAARTSGRCPGICAACRTFVGGDRSPSLAAPLPLSWFLRPWSRIWSASCTKDLLRESANST
jgi:hypothetical protein